MREIDFGQINLERQTPEPNQNISHSIVGKDGEIKGGEETYQTSEILANLVKIEQSQIGTEHKVQDNSEREKGQAGSLLI